MEEFLFDGVRRAAPHSAAVINQRVRQFERGNTGRSLVTRDSPAGHGQGARTDSASIFNTIFGGIIGAAHGVIIGGVGGATIGAIIGAILGSIFGGVDGGFIGGDLGGDIGGDGGGGGE